MASSIDFVQYIVDQCSEAGEVVAKKMFGDEQETQVSSKFAQV